MTAVPGDTLAHCTGKCCQGPASDAGLWIGRKIRSIDDSERCVDAVAARVGSSLGSGVARHAMPFGGQNLSFGNQACWETGGIRSLNGCDSAPPGQKSNNQHSKRAGTDDQNCHSPNQGLALCELDLPEEILANRASLPQLAMSGDPPCEKPRWSIRDDGWLQF